MSHPEVLLSPADSPLRDRTVGEIVAEFPLLARVFQSHGIDFCCQGGRTVRQACEAKGIPVETVEGQLEEGMKTAVPAGENPAILPPAELIRHIVTVHHDYLRAELPRLEAMAFRVARVHGGHTPALVEVYETFLEMAGELNDHLGKEEQVLFPAILALVRGEAGMPIHGPVACMLQEHDDAGAALARLRELTNGFTPPPEACNTYRTLFVGLRELEGDLHRHIHLENSVLFPTALALAEIT